MNKNDRHEQVKECTRTVVEDILLWFQPSLSLEELSTFVFETGRLGLCRLVRNYIRAGDLTQEEAECQIRLVYEAVNSLMMKEA